MLPCETPLPLVKRPFPEEPLGGWLGRLAGFYKMGIDELAWNLGLNLGLDDGCHDWLILPQQSPENLDRIGHLTRIDPEVLRALEVDKSWNAARHQYRFCRTCLFVNAIDVTAPRWIRDWLNPDFEVCPEHGEMEELERRDLSDHRNLSSILKLVSLDSSIWNRSLRTRERDRYASREW